MNAFQSLSLRSQVFVAMAWPVPALAWILLQSGPAGTTEWVVAAAGLALMLLTGLAIASGVKETLGGEPADVAASIRGLSSGTADRPTARSGALGALGDLWDRFQSEEEAGETSGLRKEIIADALTTANSMVMIADKNHNIEFCNRSLDRMLREYEHDIRQSLPNFRAAEVLGANIDIFHRRPEHNRSMVTGLVDTHDANITLGDKFFSLAVTPVKDSTTGERVGTVVEWYDRTAENKMIQEIDATIKATQEGNFDRRVDMAAIKGVAASSQAVCQGVNDVLDGYQQVVNEMASLFEKMAEGDLSGRLHGDWPGRLADLQNDADRSLTQIADVLGRIKGAAGSVKTGAGEISLGNNNLSQRTEQQASSLEETASSMQQMTDTVRQNAESAQQASSLAQSASEQAARGGEIVNKAVAAMEEINASSQKIADIIGVIDEIAFQTNLLALNASVEAARAGDQGRGFAVVASEVRNLAGRSATAAREIKDLIEDSGRKVAEGSRLVNDSGGSLSEIVGAVTQVTDIVSEIADASRAQASGIEEVNQAVRVMDELTQQNGALVEEAAAASQSLGEQADELDRMMGYFSGAGHAAGPASTGASHHPAARTASVAPIKQAVNDDSAWSGGGAAVVNGSDQEWAEF